MAYALGTVLILASFWKGGGYWAVVYAAAILGQWRTGLRYSAAIPLVWVALFALTGDRRLFFPFAMHQAVTFGISWGRGYAAGCGLIVALFTVIRIEQDASFRVIAVEIVVAVVAICVGAACRRFGSIGAALAASAVALAGLLL